MNYEWIISSMDCTPSLDGLTDVVNAVHWRYRATNENGVSAETYGVISVGQPNPVEFTDYQNLTFIQVSGWLETIYSKPIELEEGQTEEKLTQLQEMQNNLIKQIELIETPVNITLPPPF